MKTQKQIADLISSKIEEINLSQKVELAAMDPMEIIKVTDVINKGINNLKTLAGKAKDGKLTSLVQKLIASNEGVLDHVSSEYVK
jgi:hypothetical protein